MGIGSPCTDFNHLLENIDDFLYAIIDEDINSDLKDIAKDLRNLVRKALRELADL